MSEAAEDERPESAADSVADRQAGRSPATATAHDALLREQDILGDHRSHATGAAQLPDDDDEMEPGEQDVLRARVSVGPTSSRNVAPSENQRGNW